MCTCRRVASSNTNKTHCDQGYLVHFHRCRCEPRVLTFPVHWPKEQTATVAHTRTQLWIILPYLSCPRPKKNRNIFLFATSGLENFIRILPKDTVSLLFVSLLLFLCPCLRLGWITHGPRRAQNTQGNQPNLSTKTAECSNLCKTIGKTLTKCTTTASVNQPPTQAIIHSKAQAAKRAINAQDLALEPMQHSVQAHVCSIPSRPESQIMRQARRLQSLVSQIL